MEKSGKLIHVNIRTQVYYAGAFKDHMTHNKISESMNYAAKIGGETQLSPLTMHIELQCEFC